jgi:hypothetical protein
MWANFISHCDEGAIFHNFRKEIISHSAQAEYFTKNPQQVAGDIQGLRLDLFVNV